MNDLIRYISLLWFRLLWFRKYFPINPIWASRFLLNRWFLDRKSNGRTWATKHFQNTRHEAGNPVANKRHKQFLPAPPFLFTNACVSVLRNASLSASGQDSAWRRLQRGKWTPTSRGAQAQSTWTNSRISQIDQKKPSRFNQSHHFSCNSRPYFVIFFVVSAV